jgi:hypothetical protein
MNDNEQSKSKNKRPSHRVFNVVRLALVGFDPTTFGL